MHPVMKIGRNISVLLALMLLAGCQSEKRYESQKKSDDGGFTHLFTELSVKCENDMSATCDLVCSYVHPNGLKEEVQTNGRIFMDTILVTNVKTFPIVLKLELDASSNGTATGSSDLKCSYGMTVSSAKSLGSGMYKTIEGDYDSDAFSVKQVEPDSIDFVLDRYLPITVTATITKDGKVSIK